MKKFFFVVIAGCSLMACNNSGNTNVASSNTDSTSSQAQKNLATLRDVYKAIASGDSTKFNAISDDFIDHDGPGGKEMKGPEVKKFLTDMHNHVKGLDFEITADAASGDYAFVFGTFHGTANDNSMGAPAGTKLDSHFADVIKFNKDGKATERWGFDEDHEMMQMMQSMQQKNAPNNKMKTDSAAGKM